MIINLSNIKVLWTLLCCFTIFTVAEPKLFDFGSGNTFLLISAALQLRLYTVLQHLYELFWLSEKLQLSKNNLHTEKLLLLWWAGYTLRNQLIRDFFCKWETTRKSSHNIWKMVGLWFPSQWFHAADSMQPPGSPWRKSGQRARVFGP